MSRINYGSFWTKILLNKEEVEKIKLKLNKEIAEIEDKIEHLGSRQNELEDDKLNINKEIAEIEKIKENFEDQFDKLEFEGYDPKIYFSDLIEDDYKALISWEMPAALEYDETGWSSVMKWDREIYRQMLKKQLPIGSGICYVLSVPENENWSKIGFTTKSAQERAEDYSKEHDLELNVAGIVADDNAAALEKILHEEFSSKRVKHGSAKEIFAVPPKECFEKIKSFKRDISLEMMYRQGVLLQSQILRNNARINKNKYKIPSIDENIARIILRQRDISKEKLEKIYDLKCLSLSSMEKWYRFYDWKAHFNVDLQLILKYILITSVLLLWIYQIFD